MLPTLHTHDGTLPIPSEHLRFVVISDTHTDTHRITVPPGDVLLHCGDICKRGGSLQQIETFNDFLQQQPHAAKIVIAGNHDICFDHENFFRLKEAHKLDPYYMPINPYESLTSATYLQDSGVRLCGYNIWGSPWVPKYSNTAFSIKRNSPILVGKRMEIPVGTDILMTHCPPLGTLDLSKKGKYGGCSLLAERVQQVNPIVHIFGHIHEGHGSLLTEKTLFINAAIRTPIRGEWNQPLVFDLPNNKRDLTLL